MKKLYTTLLFLFLLSTQIEAQRIVTGGSSSTEIVCALGLCDQIVGTDRTSLYPEQVRSLPSIGYRTDISTEGIISMNPDVIILEKEYIKDIVIEQLDKAGLQLVQIDNQHNFENTKDKIMTIAKALEVEDRGKALVQKLDTQLNSLETRVQNGGTQPTILCVYNRGRGNMMVAGNDTGFGLIKLAGLKNALPEIQGYKPLNVEYLISTNPDYILFFESGIESLGGMKGVLEIPGVAQTTAGKKGQIIALDGGYLTNWGPRVIEAATELFELTHNNSNE